MIEFEEYKGKLNGLKPILNDLESALHLDAAQREIEELQRASEQEGFWNDVEKSQKSQKRLKQLQEKYARYQRLCTSWDDLYTICEMALEEMTNPCFPNWKANFRNSSSSWRLPVWKRCSPENMTATMPF